MQAKGNRVYFVARQSITKDGSKQTDEQFELMEDAGAKHGWQEVGRGEEKDTSGGAPLAKRPGLRAAVEAIERGEADVIVVAYFDRLVRSLRVQAEVCERVEQAGGSIVALDVGEVANGTSAQWLTSGFLGLVAEYQRRSTAERVKGSQASAIAEGRPIAPILPLGMRRNARSRVIEHDPELAPIIVEMFERRLAGATVRQLRHFLRDHGLVVTESRIYKTLTSRVVLGEIRWGAFVNAEACAPLVPPSLWRRVNDAVKPRGRMAKSERLLARLGVLRCGNCDARLVTSVSHRKHGDHRAVYRCSAGTDCRGCGTIGADTADAVAWEATCAAAIALGVDHGLASLDTNLEEAQARVELAQAAFDSAVVTFDGFGGDAVRVKLRELQDEVDAATEAHEELRRIARHSRRVNVTDPDLSMSARRELVRDLLDRITLMPAVRVNGRYSDSRERLLVTTRELFAQ